MDDLKLIYDKSKEQFLVITQRKQFYLPSRVTGRILLEMVDFLENENSANNNKQEE